ILTFQASAFDHSATAPHALEGGPLVGTMHEGKLAKATFKREGLTRFARRSPPRDARLRLEPSIRFWRILTFQASAFDHSATAPHALEGDPLVSGARQGKLGLSPRRRSPLSSPPARRPSR